MHRGLSLYLDLVRFCAALTVFLSHVAGQRITCGFLWQFGPYGSEAVMVFFVLSGFVIAFVADKRETSGTQYAISRAARLYSVAVPALLLTAVLDAIGRSVHPGLYNASWGYSAQDLPMQFLRALTFTNAAWVPTAGPGSDLPFWSLGYEAPYYLIFGLAVFAPPRWRLPGALLALALAGPAIAALFPIWLAGVGCYHACTRLRIGPVGRWMLLACPLLAWASYEALMWRTSLPRQNWIVGLLFAAHLAGAHATAPLLETVLDRVAKPVRWLSGATFSIYLFHMPLLQFLTTITPWPLDSWQNRLMMVGGVLAVILALSVVTERRKGWWHRLFDDLLRRARSIGAKIAVG